MHLQVQGLACRRGGRLLFQGVDLTVEPGEVVWIRGPNGRGKSSLLRLLAGLGEPALGNIRRYAPLVYLGHQHALKDDLSALEALTFLVALGDPEGGVDTSRLIHALDQLGVKGKRHALVRTLSQGQRRRVALARLLMSAPGAVWVLDEPLDSLDDQGVRQVLAMLCVHQAAGGSVVMTSHLSIELPGVRAVDLALPERELAACGH
jgi:heme exporter protein A